MRGVAPLGARSGVRGRARPRPSSTAKARSDLGSLGWTAALRTHRPFLSYNELGSLLDEGPSKLYDALSSILGLEDLVEAQGALQEARRSREKALKDATDARGRLVERLREVDDDSGAAVSPALEGKEWDLGAVEEVLGGAASGSGSGRGRRAAGIASLEPPEPERVAAAAAEMRAAAAALQSALGRPPPGRATRRRCSTSPSGITPPTATATARCAAEAAPWTAPGASGSGPPRRRLREAAREADAVHERAEAARRQWEGLAVLKGDALTRAAAVGLDLGELVGSAGGLGQGGIDRRPRASWPTTSSRPADRCGRRSSACETCARAQLGRKEDAWRPVAVEVAAWLAGAREAVRGAADLKRLKAAEAWLKKAAAGIRDDRFAPIAEKAARIWEHLRQQSHVELGESSSPARARGGAWPSTSPWTASRAPPWGS